MQNRKAGGVALKIAVLADFRMNSVKKLSDGCLGLGKKWILGSENTLIA